MDKVEAAVIAETAFDIVAAGIRIGDDMGSHERMLTVEWTERARALSFARRGVDHSSNRDCIANEGEG